MRQLNPNSRREAPLWSNLKSKFGTPTHTSIDDLAVPIDHGSYNHPLIDLDLDPGLLGPFLRRTVR